jgi:glycosyltransferase involved in cell wall biosynthesis
MRVLVSAYACTPGRGSEQGVGWHRIRQLARFHEVWAITRMKNRVPIEAVLAQEPMPNVHWIYHDLPRWARFWKKKQRGIHPYYYLWQLTTYFKARRLHRQVGFDQVHHVTFVNYWMPSFLALLPVPFIWGPVGGGEAPPASFWRCYSPRGKVFEILRALGQRIGEMDPFLRATARRAAVALATTESTAKRLRILGCRDVIVYSEAGLPQEEIDQLSEIPNRCSNGFRLVSLGELLHLKGFELALRAFAQFHMKFSQSEYWLMGDGPERERLERLAKELGVNESVKFWGRIPRSEVLEKLEQCDVLVHPSLHDSGGWVCIEAMAAGRPVICLDIGGPGFQITEQTGFKVQPIAPKQAIADLAKAMEQLARNPALGAQMGEAGRQLVRSSFAWDKKGEWLRDLGARVARLDRRGSTLEGTQNAGWSDD